MELCVEDFDKLFPYKLKNSKKPTAIMFKGNFCGFCKHAYPMWKDVRKRMLFMNVHTFTIDDSQEKADHFDKINASLTDGKIEGLPTFLFYKPGGDEIYDLSGGDITFEDVLEEGKRIAT